MIEKNELVIASNDWARIINDAASKGALVWSDLTRAYYVALRTSYINCGEGVEFLEQINPQYIAALIVENSFDTIGRSISALFYKNFHDAIDKSLWLMMPIVSHRRCIERDGGGAS